ncbi:hypothetical protein GCM10027079_10120 [Sediminivirga luteola]|uniref:Uncharacterized protein n=1 Tax=Sediminivirga luteola TaxID=1774748 RepID=A0A8J2TZ26_9MICO|nr:hypothetical protein GCM10011333_21180 [Sediminivirga luteola]
MDDRRRDIEVLEFLTDDVRKADLHLFPAGGAAATRFRIGTPESRVAVFLVALQLRATIPSRGTPWPAPALPPRTTTSLTARFPTGFPAARAVRVGAGDAVFIVALSDMSNPALWTERYRRGYRLKERAQKCHGQENLENP